MDSENEILIKIDVEFEKVEKLSKQFGVLQTGVKELDYAFRAEKISADQLALGLENIEAKASKLKLSYKQNVDLGAQIYQVNQRAANGFTSMGKSLADVQEGIRKTNPMFISFNQVVQDAPYGLRGMGNNIQFLTQQFTQLRASGMSTGTILSGMMSNILTPMGALMIAVSFGTSLLQMALEKLGQQDKTKDKLVDLTDAITDLRHELGYLSEAQYLAYLNEQIAISGIEANKAIEPTSAYFEQFKSFGKWLLNNPVGWALWGVYKVVETSAQGYLKLARMLNTAMNGGVVVQGTFTDEDLTKGDKALQEQLQNEKKRKDYLDDLRKKRADARKKALAESKNSDVVNMIPYSSQSELDNATWLFGGTPEQQEAGAKAGDEAGKKREEEKKQQEDDEQFSVDLQNEFNERSVKNAEKWNKEENKQKIEDDADAEQFSYDLQNEFEERSRDNAIARNKEALDQEANDYQEYLINPMMAGMYQVADAWDQQFAKNLNATFRNGKTVMDQFFIGMLMELNRVIERALIMQMLFSILDLAGGGEIAKNLGLKNVFGLATGGPVQDGFTMVGEQGPELLSKRGNNAFVYNNSQTTAMGVAASARSKMQSAQRMHVTGEFVQRGTDLVAVVEYTQLKRGIRSMKVGS